MARWARLDRAMTTSMTPEAWRDRLELTYVPSAYQAAIFDFVADGEGNGVVEACAGSGKTTTIVSCAKLVESGLFLAFNRSIATMLNTELKGTGMVASTVHSHGFGAVRRAFGRVKVDAGKYRDFVDGCIAEVDAAQTLRGDALTPAEIKSVIDDGFPRSSTLKLIDLARLSLVAPEAGPGFAADLLALADHHNIDFPGAVEQLIVDVARLAMQWGADNPRIVDFTDMVWLPCQLGLQPATYSSIFVDECQDISKAHRVLIGRSLTKNGRLLAIGDRNQAIYGFAGADSASFQAIITEFDAKVLPLSVCYRCPTSVLDLAREIVPQIEARPGAPEGVVRSSTTDAFLDEARRGDMVLCRLNAPLLSLAFKLIGNGVSAAVRGRDLGKGLAKVITVAAKGRSFADFGLGLDDWEDREKDQARKRYGKRSEDALAARLEAISDQAECIRVIWISSGAKSANELKAAIAKLFEDQDPKVVLSSVHRAKGLEAPRVFIAKPERLGQAWPNSRPWMVEQERNLLDVAVTRAQEELVMLDGVIDVGGDDDEDDDPIVAGIAGPCHKCGAPVDGLPVMSVVQSLKGPGHHAHVDCAHPGRKHDPGYLDRDAKPENDQPAPLPPVAADAPDTYDPHAAAARVALARRLDAELRGLGFTPSKPARGYWEVIYTRKRGRVTCKVASTIEGGQVRGVGKDSIKVSLVRDADTVDERGIGKTKRVHRVGKIASIVGHVKLRIASLTA